MRKSQNPSSVTDIRRSAAHIDTRPGYLPAVCLFAACSLLLAWPWLSGTFTIPWDAKAEFYPQLVFLARSLHSGESPFWAPNVFGGQPQIADPQSLIFSLPFLILALFNSSPGFQAADAAVFATLFCGGLAIMMFFRDRNWHPAGGLVAAFVFSFGASNAWRIQHIGQVMSLCWFAVALWLLARTLQRQSVLWGLLTGIAAGMMIIGRDQIALLCSLILAAYVIAQILQDGALWRNIRAYAGPLIAAAVAGVVTIAIPIALTAIYAGQSNRPVITYENAVAASLHPAAFFTLISADLFGTAGPMAKYWGPPTPEVWNDRLALARNMADIYLGALPVIIVLLMGLARGRLLDRQIRFFSLAAVFSALYALGKYTPFFQLAYELPGADFFRRPADATFPLGAAIAIMAGYLIHHFIEDSAGLSRRQVAFGGALTLCTFLSCVWIAWSKGYLSQAAEPLVISGISFMIAGLGLWAIRHYRTSLYLVLGLIAALMSADLAFNIAPNESTALPPAVYDVLRMESSNPTIAMLEDGLQKSAAPDRRDRVEMSAIGFAWPDAALVHGFDHWLGYNPLILSWYANATGAIDHVAIPEQRTFSPLFNSYRSPMLDLLGVRFIATGVPAAVLDKSYKPGDLTEIARTRDAYIYENPRALPRVLVATQMQEVNFDRMIETGVWPVVDFKTTVLLESSQNTQAKPDLQVQPRTRARILSYRNTEISVETSSDSPGWLVLHDTWHPWWRVEVDGRPAQLLRANVIFRAVAIPAGRHVVSFNFHPFAGLMQSVRGT